MPSWWKHPIGVDKGAEFDQKMIPVNMSALFICLAQKMDPRIPYNAQRPQVDRHDEAVLQGAQEERYNVCTF